MILIRFIDRNHVIGSLLLGALLSAGNSMRM